jgi:hypothetical protein
MIDAGPELTADERRGILKRAIRHQQVLVRDARLCGLWPVERRRRDLLRQLREQLADLAARTRRWVRLCTP